MINMKLWLLEPDMSISFANKESPWHTYYDMAHGFIIRAETEQDARKLATEKAGGECERWTGEGLKTMHAWSDPKYSTCKELLYDGEVGILMRDFRAG